MVLGYVFVKADRRAALELQVHARESVGVHVPKELGRVFGAQLVVEIRGFFLLHDTCVRTALALVR
jgi:hypothetical protein